MRFMVGATSKIDVDMCVCVSGKGGSSMHKHHGRNVFGKCNCACGVFVRLLNYSRLGACEHTHTCTLELFALLVFCSPLSTPLPSPPAIFYSFAGFSFTFSFQASMRRFDSRNLGILWMHTFYFHISLFLSRSASFSLAPIWLGLPHFLRSVKLTCCTWPPHAMYTYIMYLKFIQNFDPHARHVLHAYEKHIRFSLAPSFCVTPE